MLCSQRTLSKHTVGQKGFGGGGGIHKHGLGDISQSHEREGGRRLDQVCLSSAFTCESRQPSPTQPHALTGMTVVDICLTAGAFEPGLAEAAVAPVRVLTHSTILTGALHTFIDVNLTGLS